MLCIGSFAINLYNYFNSVMFYKSHFLTAASLVAVILFAGYDEGIAMKDSFESCLKMAVAYKLDAEKACKRW